MITLLAPPSTQKEEIIAIMKEFEEECSKQHRYPRWTYRNYLCCNKNSSLLHCSFSLEKSRKTFYQVKDGDDIIITKGVGIEGIAILAQEKSGA